MKLNSGRRTDGRTDDRQTDGVSQSRGAIKVVMLSSQVAAYSAADLSVPPRSEIRNGECIIGPSNPQFWAQKRARKRRNSVRRRRRHRIEIPLLLLPLLVFSKEAVRRPPNLSECVCVYGVMRGDPIHPFATPSPATASHDFEVLHDVDCGGEGKREGKGEGAERGPRERAGKLTPPLLYFIIIFVFWEKERKEGGRRGGRESEAQKTLSPFLHETA